MLHAMLFAAVLYSSVILAFVLVNLAVIPKLSRPRRRGQERSLPLPRVSIIVPARNEEREIAAGAASLLAQDYPDFEVVVVDDRSTDGTAGILAALARQSGRLRVVSGREPSPGWLGKPHALHQGAAAASGEVFLFVDADVRYDPRTLREAMDLLEAEQLDFLAILPRLEAKGFWEHVLMPFVLGAFFAGPGFLANTPWPRRVAAGGGAGNLIRRSAYDAIGGHAALRDSIVDDVHLAFRAKSAGLRNRVVRGEDRAVVRMYRGFREVWDGFAKNIAYVINGAFGLLFLALLALLFAASVLPAAVLLGAILGVAVPAKSLLLAAAGFGILVLARALLAAAFHDPLWPSLTHPIMTVIWTGIVLRSLYWRFVKKQVLWRGRHYDAARARF